MVTKSFFVISFLPTLCSHFEVGRRFAECSAEGSPNVPHNIILGREDWVIRTWK